MEESGEDCMRRALRALMFSPMSPMARAIWSFVSRDSSTGIDDNSEESRGFYNNKY
jgi:hypothetical protein